MSILRPLSITAAAAAVALSVPGCAPGEDAPPDAGDPPAASLTQIAEGYVGLVLATGVHDPAYVDAYYGPPEWRERAERDSLPIAVIRDSAAALGRALAAVDAPVSVEIERLRIEYLQRQLESVVSRTEILLGATLTFDQESRALYDAVAPTNEADAFQAVLDELERRLPGTGSLEQRYGRWRDEFVIPPERLDTVFQAAIAESRRRTAEHLDLPPNERFELEYVTDKSWSGYNWYQGNAHSLIQINTDLPIHIDRAVDLAAHEGYPGHHVYNVLLEQSLVKDRGWPEFQVYPLFSPQSLIAEGSANYGIDVAFPGDQRVLFERDVLYPLAGLDPSRASEYRQIQDLVGRLSYAGNEAARRYLDGQFTREQAAEWLETYALMNPERSLQRTRFMDDYRSYVINYNLGRDLVADYVERLGGTDDAPERRWSVFGSLLASPRLPSGLRE